MRKHLKKLCIALFATLLVCSTIIGASCYSHAKNDASLLTKANVEAMSDGESFEAILIGAGLNLVGRLIYELGEWIYEELTDDGTLYCRQKQGECKVGHKISFRQRCQERIPILETDTHEILEYYCEFGHRPE